MMPLMTSDPEAMEDVLRALNVPETAIERAMERGDPLAALFAALPVLAAAESFDRLLPVSDVLLSGVHRRWVERETAQIAVRAAESGPGSELLSAVDEVTILFCDLKDFTAFADRQGDGAAVNIIDRFA